MFLVVCYVLSVIVLFISFLLVKKSDAKLNFVSQAILSFICFLAYNIAVVMIFGNLNFTTNLVFLCVFNFIVSIILFIKIFKDKVVQRYEFRVRDFIAMVVVLLIVGYISYKQYRTFDLTVANGSVDASMHYSAASTFADYMKPLSKVDHGMGYNFTTMQTGAYINNGIFMNIMRHLRPEYKEYVTFKIFEIGILALNIASFYMLISKKLDSKINYIVGIVFLILYGFAYPYTNLLYGFSYLSVSISFATGLFYVSSLYVGTNHKSDSESIDDDSFHIVKGKKNNIEEDLTDMEINSFWFILFVVLMGIGIIFSYCLFVPALYAYICIYVFAVDLKNKNVKKYLIFSRNTLIMTGLLLIVTVLSVLYLVVPTFTLSDQNKLTDAIGFDGNLYKGLFIDFIFYIPFMILFVINSFRNKKLDYQTIAIILIGIQTIVSLLGVVYGYVSAYYYYKIYTIIWILAVEMAANLICSNKDNKEFRIMSITALCLWCAIIYIGYTNKEFRLQEKAPTLIEVCKTPSLAGIYYDSNVLATANINVSCLVNSDRLELAEHMGDDKGMTLKNMMVGGMNTNCKAWMYVVSKIHSGGASINDLQYAIVDTTVDDFMNEEEKEYFVYYTDNEFESNDGYEVIYQNKAGVILKKK